MCSYHLCCSRDQYLLFSKYAKKVNYLSNSRSSGHVQSGKEAAGSIVPLAIATKTRFFFTYFLDPRQDGGGKFPVERGENSPPKKEKGCTTNKSQVVLHYPQCEDLCDDER